MFVKLTTEDGQTEIDLKWDGGKIQMEAYSAGDEQTGWYDLAPCDAEDLITGLRALLDAKPQAIDSTDPAHTAKQGSST